MNESVISNIKLKNAIHDIVTSLKKGEKISMEELSDLLMSNYKITINPSFLNVLFDNFIKYKKGNYSVNTIFTKNDTKWLYVKDIDGDKELKNNLLYLSPILGKHKKRLKEESEKKMLEDAYKDGMKDLKFKEDNLKKSIIVNHPSDYKDIMTTIYNELVLNNKYANTEENGWRMMMLIAKNYNLDRRRGWFKISPQSIKNEFKKTGKINYDLKRIGEIETYSDANIQKVNRNSKLEKINDYLSKYESNLSGWQNFKKDTDLRTCVDLLDSLGAYQNSSIITKMGLFEDIILNKFHKLRVYEFLEFLNVIGIEKYYRKSNSSEKGGYNKKYDF